MKHIILTAVFLSLSSLAFADECPQLKGKYLCPETEEEPSYLLVINQKTSENGTVEYDIEDDLREHVVTDNKSRKSKVKNNEDGKEYSLFTKAKCKNKELILESTMVEIKNGEAEAAQATFNYYLDQNKNIFVESAFSSKGEGYEEIEMCIRQ